MLTHEQWKMMPPGTQRLSPFVNLRSRTLVPAGADSRMIQSPRDVTQAPSMLRSSSRAPKLSVPSVASRLRPVAPGRRCEVSDPPSSVHLCHVIFARQFWIVILCLALCGICVPSLHASPQQQVAASSTPGELPDAPVANPLQTPPASSSQVGAYASLAGIACDQSGAVVPEARITLSDGRGATELTAISDPNGRFSFPRVAPGRYRVKATSNGLGTYLSEEIVLAAGENRDLQQIRLPMAAANANVEVFATQHEVAEAQVHLAEKQRVLGIVPNFYSSYIWNATPLTPRLKTGLALRSILDPVAFVAAAGLAGVEQYHNTFPGYGRGADGYAKRYGAAYADGAIDRILGSAVFPSLFHQDPRYFYKGSGGTRSRALYAVEATVITRGDNGHSQPNYSHILGNFAAAGISNIYRSPQDRGASLTFRNGLIITGSNAVTNLLREFVLRKLTRNVPVSSQQKP
jgi:hypothetical protein